MVVFILIRIDNFGLLRVSKLLFTLFLKDQSVIGK